MRIAREAVPFVVVAAVLVAVAWLVAGVWAAAPFVLGLAFTVWFFRDPDRRPPDDPAVLISPADGRVIEATSRPTPDGGWVSSHEDVTERVNYETALRDQNMLFDAALENMAHALCMFDKDWRVIVHNRRFLELYGFKSFADRTTLSFDHSLVGIVGPNGCGKSNVVDAIRWVLGETRPTSMRGGEMIDVIFKGSVSRPSMSVADVSLILDNARAHDFGSWLAILTTPYWPPPFPPELYRPITSLLMSAEYVLGAGAPLVFRVVSYLLYAACSLAVFSFASRLVSHRVALAVALLFALLESNPAPFCVLDEVDAALDESNVNRFGQALKNLTGRTQFVVITHSRGTIQAADTIYGVSMTGDGVSNVLSLRLADVPE